MHKHIPNILTSLNLLCGCIGIYYLVEVNFYIAALLIIIAALFDFLDGMSARILNAYSPVGKSLDSLADLVSFGILPGLLLLKLQLSLTGTGIGPEFRSEYTLSHYIIIFFPLLIPLFSALRLAKFDNDPSQAEVFRGLPTPANALFIAALVWSAPHGIKGMMFIHNSALVFIVTTVMAILLISPFRFISLKLHNLSWKDNYMRYLLIAAAIACLIIWRIPGIMFIIVLYLILSVFSMILNCLRGLPNHSV